jgi:hypothetical protein
METEKQITEAIAQLTLEIREKHPEMSKYMGEMPVTNPDTEHPDINAKILKDYYDTLVAQIKRYAEQHDPSTLSQRESTQDSKL